MGRLENFKTRGRNRENRKRKSLVVIGCEGNNKTEEIYFKNYNSKDCMIKFSKGNSTDPVGIVNDVVKFIKNEIGKEDEDKYYVVFDTDINKGLQSEINKAKEIAKENNIEIITSTPSFEIWFRLHFGYTAKLYNSSDDLINDLGRKIKGYKKNINVYSIIERKTDEAIKNAKKLEKHHLELGRVLDNDICNPYTGTYKVVEELIKRNKKSDK